MAAGDDAGRVVVFESESKALLRVLTGHKAAVRAVKWTGGKGGKVASASDDKTVRLWDVSTGECVLEWEVRVIARLLLVSLLLSWLCCLLALMRFRDFSYLTLLAFQQRGMMIIFAQWMLSSLEGMQPVVVG